jgi:hypothetical protein
VLKFINTEGKLKIEWFQVISSRSSKYFNEKSVRANALVIPPFNLRVLNGLLAR